MRDFLLDFAHAAIFVAVAFGAAFVYLLNWGA